MKKLLLLCLCWHWAHISHSEEWKRALPGYQIQFPRDHRAHKEFKTEWWYLTGNLSSASGEQFGYQLTLFRQGVNPNHAQLKTTSRYIVPEFYFAHFAVTDINRQRYRHEQKVRRGVFDEAGVGGESSDRLIWIDDWEITQTGPESFRLRAAHHDMAIDLTVQASKPPVFHGENGLSQKAAGAGNASFYYSFTRMATKGTVSIDGKSAEVSGGSWMDREWATNQLGENQAGWDWFSIQLDSGEELMLYQMRLKSGGSDPMSSGTFITKEGASKHLRREEFTLVPTKTWKSPETGTAYPIAWTVKIPSLALELSVEAAMPAQELVARPVTYWEGSIKVSGKQAGSTTGGRGYLELTGYGAALEQL